MEAEVIEINGASMIDKTFAEILETIVQRVREASGEKIVVSLEIGLYKFLADTAGRRLCSGGVLDGAPLGLIQWLKDLCRDEGLSVNVGYAWHGEFRDRFKKCLTFEKI